MFFSSNFLLSIDCAKFCNSVLVYFALKNLVILQTGKIPTGCRFSTSKNFTLFLSYFLLSLWILRLCFYELVYCVCRHERE